VHNRRGPIGIAAVVICAAAVTITACRSSAPKAASAAGNAAAGNATAGSGSIQDSVTEVVTTWCSGSKPRTESLPLASGNASGGYGIATAEYDGGDTGNATAEYDGGDTGNATQAESDAGC
jgi:hypothetical protein